MRPDIQEDNYWRRFTSKTQPRNPHVLIEAMKVASGWQVTRQQALERMWALVARGVLKFTPDRWILRGDVD